MTSTRNTRPDPHRRRRARLLPAMLALALLGGTVVACSDDDPEPATPTDPVETPDVMTEEPDVITDLAASFAVDLTPPTSPEPVEVDLADGTSARVVDVGPADGIPVLFIGGTGTSATVVRLVEFLSEARERLGIRLVSIDRNGFGDAPLDEKAGYDDFATTALGVLDALDIGEFSMVAISGGGPYSAAVAAAAPGRIRSVHLAAAYTGDPIAGTLGTLCALPAESLPDIALGQASDPVAWWSFPDDAPVHLIDGFVDAAVADAIRTFRVTDDGNRPEGLVVEFGLFCEPTTTDVSAVAAPTFLYYGDEDTTVPGEYADQWARRYSHVVADRRFPDVAHDVTYRHWGQVLLDIADPDDPRDLYCVDGQPVLAPHGQRPDGAEVGLDVCAWSVDR